MATLRLTASSIRPIGEPLRGLQRSLISISPVAIGPSHPIPVKSRQPPPGLELVRELPKQEKLPRQYFSPSDTVLEASSTKPGKPSDENKANLGTSTGAPSFLSTLKTMS
jgi:hypothetical protein